MKSLSLEGGITNFRIPDEWIAESLPDGGMISYPASQPTPTLRMNLLTFATPEKQDSRAIETYVRSRAKGGSSFRKLKNGDLLLSHSEATTEQGDRLRVIFWEVAHVFPPQHFQLAVFSLTVLEEDSPDGSLPLSCQWIEQEVQSLQFPRRPVAS
jgi:hypothetical protein